MWASLGLAVKYRLYVDEVGNPDLKSSRDPNHRYLSLTGVIFELQYVQDFFGPKLEGLKRKYFGSHPDDPVILHRKELVNRRHPFHALRNPDTEAAFNSDLLDLLTDSEFTAITVVIDKFEHNERYRKWQYDPYHYCLKVLVERFVLWLRAVDTQGDVMSEARGGKENQRLKEAFKRVFNLGSEYVEASVFQDRLTSRELKVKQKANNVAGLQLADLVAHPSFKAALAKRNNEALPDGFGRRITEVLEATKYYRNSRGKIEGWGRKWLP